MSAEGYGEGHGNPIYGESSTTDECSQCGCPNSCAEARLEEISGPIAELLVQVELHGTTPEGIQTAVWDAAQAVRAAMGDERGEVVRQSPEAGRKRQHASDLALGQGTCYRCKGPQRGYGTAYVDGERVLLCHVSCQCHPDCYVEHNREQWLPSTR